MILMCNHSWELLFQKNPQRTKLVPGCYGIWSFLGSKSTSFLRTLTPQSFQLSGHLSPEPVLLRPLPRYKDGPQPRAQGPLSGAILLPTESLQLRAACWVQTQFPLPQHWNLRIPAMRLRKKKLVLPAGKQPSFMPELRAMSSNASLFTIGAALKIKKIHVCVKWSFKNTCKIHVCVKHNTWLVLGELAI